MNFKEYNLIINGALLPYLINGDASGLEEWETEAADAYLADCPNAIFEPETEGHFARCDILGEHGHCYDVKVFTPAEANA